MAMTLLIIHLIGAGLLSIIFVTALYQLVRSAQLSAMVGQAKAVALGTALQLITGSLLMIATPQASVGSSIGPSVWRFCANISLYVIAVVAIEFMLSMRIKKLSGAVSGVFPKRVIQTSGGLSALFIVAAIVIQIY